METASAPPAKPALLQSVLALPLPQSYLNFVGHQIFRLLQTMQGVGAFALITLGVTLTKFNASWRVIHPLIRAQIDRAGVRLLPGIVLLGLALGLVIVGQTVSLLQKVGAEQYAGTVMVTVLIRELGPLATALVVLARVGTAIVIELGLSRAQGEVEALEALGIDPVHYLVMPRVIGLAAAIFSLTVYLILVAVVSGYLFVFLQDVPLLPGDYFNQIARALAWEDFALLGLKTATFGAIIATVTCYQGLAQRLRLEEVSDATTRAVAQSVAGCVLADALFILVYLFM
ncbi:MAG: ABC transporter permease [Verrucomicrobia bacterium]|nr:ABC transporter permease [Verrucomicrobiota bacterium]